MFTPLLRLTHYPPSSNLDYWVRVYWKRISLKSTFRDQVFAYLKSDYDCCYNLFALSTLLAWVSKEQERIPLREHRPSLKPTHQHHQPDHDGNQQEQIRRFPNQYFTDVHCEAFTASVLRFR